MSRSIAGVLVCKWVCASVRALSAIFTREALTPVDLNLTASKVSHTAVRFGNQGALHNKVFNIRPPILAGRLRFGKPICSVLSEHLTIVQRISEGPTVLTFGRSEVRGAHYNPHCEVSRLHRPAIANSSHETLSC